LSLFLFQSRLLFYINVDPHVGRFAVKYVARIQMLVQDYASDSLMAHEEWEAFMRYCVLKAEKRLGPDRTTLALDLVKSRKVAEVAELMLTYYDRLYDKHIANAGFLKHQNLSAFSCKERP
jgi:hypothetical protein